MPARRMRHREPRGDHPAVRNFQDDAAVPPPVAPAVDHVAGADGRDVTRPAVNQGQAVEAAAILGRLLAQKRRPPKGREARALRQSGEAPKARGDEDDAASAVDGDVVDIEVAGREADLGDIKAIMTLVRLPGLKQVLKVPELILPRQGR